MPTRSTPSLPPPPPQQLLTGIRVVDPNTIQMDLGPRFSTFRASPPVSSGAAAVVTIELARHRRRHVLRASAPGGATADKPGAPAAPGAPVAPVAPLATFPVFGGATRPTIRTIVIDPGHGGDDSGVKGAGGALEKDVALAVARRLKGAIEGRLGMRVLLTRKRAIASTPTAARPSRTTTRPICSSACTPTDRRGRPCAAPSSTR